VINRLAAEASTPACHAVNHGLQQSKSHHRDSHPDDRQNGSQFVTQRIAQQ
jgi:hypothetical protein